MFDNFGSLDTLVTEKIEADTDFQNSLADMSDEDKETAIKTKKSELLDQEIALLNEKASKAEKAQELADNYKKRSEKVENELKKNKPIQDDGLSQKDLLVLAKADIHEDDIDEVIEYAKFKKVSVAEALKSNTVKTILSEKKEQRKTANATNTGTSKRAVNKITDTALLEKASKGEIPEKGSEEAERLFFARRKLERS